MIHAYWCTKRHCDQCDDCLAEGEEKYCCTCFDYVEYAYAMSKKKGQDNALHRPGSKEQA